MATHFRQLNDDLEIATLKPQLEETMSAVLGREVKKQNTGIRNQYYHAGGAAPMARDFVQSLYASTFERGDPQFAVDAYARPIRPTLFLIPHEVGAAIRNSDTECRIWLTLGVLYLFYFIDLEQSRNNHFGECRASVASLDAVRQPWFSRKPAATLWLALVWFLCRADDKIAAHAG